MSPLGKEGEQQQVLSYADAPCSRELALNHRASRLVSGPPPSPISCTAPPLTLSPQNCQNASSPTTSIHNPHILSGPRQESRARGKTMRVPTLKGPAIMNGREVQIAWCVGDGEISGSRRDCRGPSALEGQPEKTSWCRA